MNIPKCLKDNVCGIHKDGKYWHWQCANSYDPAVRRAMFEKRKSPCIDCGKLKSPDSERCVACNGKVFGQKRKGIKLSAEWAKNISLSQRGEKSHMWKGDDAGYSTIHHVIRKHFGNPKECTACGKIGAKGKRHWNIEWANKSGNYSRDIKDYVALCKKCHKGQEKTLKSKKFRWDALKRDMVTN